MRVSYVIVFVSDMKRSVSFYRDVVGLPLKFESPEWTEFATEGATMALHASRQPGSGADAAQEPQPGLCRPGLSVPDLDRFHARMIGNDVDCVQAPREVFGARIAQYLDPDGLVMSVSEERGGG
jgi:lactoylglutathione lyase